MVVMMMIVMILQMMLNSRKNFFGENEIVSRRKRRWEREKLRHSVYLSVDLSGVCVFPMYVHIQFQHGCQFDVIQWHSSDVGFLIRFEAYSTPELRFDGISTLLSMNDLDVDGWWVEGWWQQGEQWDGCLFVYVNWLLWRKMDIGNGWLTKICTLLLAI